MAKETGSPSLTGIPSHLTPGGLRFSFLGQNVRKMKNYALPFL